MPTTRTVPSIFTLALLAAVACPVPAAAQSQLTKMKDCLLIEDGYKERLDCYDAVIKPEPKANAKKAKAVSDCRFLKEEDERLACYNGFVVPKPKSQPLGKSSKPKSAGSTTTAPAPK
jgi:hypothetical protein